MSIEDYEFVDSDINVNKHHSDDISIAFSNVTSDIFIQKQDVIALAKFFNLTAEDINCTKLKDKQAEIDSADELHFDECAELRAEISRLNNIIESKRAN